MVMTEQYLVDWDLILCAECKGSLLRAETHSMVIDGEYREYCTLCWEDVSHTMTRKRGFDAWCEALRAGVQKRRELEGKA